MKQFLDIGCGPHKLEHPEWVGFDLYTNYEIPPDVQGDVFRLPFKDKTFKKVYLGHLLEHLPWDRIPLALAEVIRVTVPGGRVMVVGPCIWKAIDQGMPHWLLKQIARTEPGDTNIVGSGHEWTPDTGLTLEAMQLGGLKNVTEVPVVGIARPQWPNTVSAGWQVAAMGITPS